MQDNVQSACSDRLPFIKILKPLTYSLNVTLPHPPVSKRRKRREERAPPARERTTPTTWRANGTGERNPSLTWARREANSRQMASCAVGVTVFELYRFRKGRLEKDMVVTRRERPSKNYGPKPDINRVFNFGPIHGETAIECPVFCEMGFGAE